MDFTEELKYNPYKRRKTDTDDVKDAGYNLGCLFEDLKTMDLFPVAMM